MGAVHETQSHRRCTSHCASRPHGTASRSNSTRYRSAWPGTFNIPDIAVWMWRWKNWTVTNAPAVLLASSGNANGYLFSSLGGPTRSFSNLSWRPFHSPGWSGGRCAGADSSPALCCKARSFLSCQPGVDRRRRNCPGQPDRLRQPHVATQWHTLHGTQWHDRYRSQTRKDSVRIGSDAAIQSAREL